MEMILVSTVCPFCGKEHLVEVPLNGFNAWQNGELIQKALPNLSADDRELLISGICAECWANI